MTDPQSAGFREAGQLDWHEISLIDNEVSTLDDFEPDDGRRKTVAQYETDDWDAESTGLVSLAQAREDLAARVADPACPETDAEADVYDQLTEHDDGSGDQFADER